MVRNELDEGRICHTISDKEEIQCLIAEVDGSELKIVKYVC